MGLFDKVKNKQNVPDDGAPQEKIENPDEIRANECMKNAMELRKQGEYRAAVRQMNEAAYYFEQFLDKDDPRLEEIQILEGNMMMEARLHGQ